MKMPRNLRQAAQRKLRMDGPTPVTDTVRGNVEDRRFSKPGTVSGMTKQKFDLQKLYDQKGLTAKNQVSSQQTSSNSKAAAAQKRLDNLKRGKRF